MTQFKSIKPLVCVARGQPALPSSGNEAKNRIAPNTRKGSNQFRDVQKMILAKPKNTLSLFLVLDIYKKFLKKARKLNQSKVSKKNKRLMRFCFMRLNKYIAFNRTFKNPISRIGLKTKWALSDINSKFNESQLQFKAKQSLKQIYGNLTEAEIKSYNHKRKLLLKKRNTSNISDKNTTSHLANIHRIHQKLDNSFLSLLEQRLDVIVFRLGFARSIAEARYLIETKQILVNSHIIRDPSHSVALGSKIQSTSWISYEAKLTHMLLNLLKIPSYLLYSLYTTPLYKLLRAYKRLLLKKKSPSIRFLPKAYKAFLLSTSLNFKAYNLTKLKEINPDTYKESLKDILYPNSTSIAMRPLTGYFFKAPLEAQVYLTRNFPLHKFNNYLLKR